MVDNSNISFYVFLNSVGQQQQSWVEEGDLFCPETTPTVFRDSTVC